METNRPQSSELHLARFWSPGWPSVARCELEAPTALPVKQRAPQLRLGGLLLWEGDAMPAKPCEIGDYVLATKYDDGDPQDHWAIGFYSGITSDHYIEPRYDIVDSNGQLFRQNGFRRIKKISQARGRWLLERREQIEMSGRSLWGWLRMAMPRQQS